MRKILIIGAVVGVVVLALGVAGYVYAQNQTPQPPYPGYGPGMMGEGWHGGFGRGMLGGGWRSGEAGPLHEYMLPALAEGLGLTPEEFQARIEAGETPYQIAQAQGLSAEEIRTLFLEAHDAALEQAVADGVITQQQAEWMDQHMEQMWQDGGPGYDPCHGGSGPGGMMGGRGPGWRWNKQP